MTYTYASVGYVFEMTESGRRVKEVASKYETDFPRRDFYIKCVPDSWIKNGYVKLINKREVNDVKNRVFQKHI